MNKTIIVGAIIAVVGFLGISYLFTNKPEQTTFPEVAEIVKPTSENEIGDHTRGTGSKKLVEYYDFQCPACRTFNDYFKSTREKDASLSAKLDETYTFVYRNFPLQNIHPNAYPAALAAEAAGLQNKYFEYADELFATQDEWAKAGDPTKNFEAIATKLKLDLKQFTTDKSSAKVKAKVEADIDSGVKAQVPGTPVFYMDGTRIEFGSFDEFQKKLEENIK